MENAALKLKHAPSVLFQTIGEVKLPGGLVFSPNYIHAGAIVLCIFLLILTFGMLQHRYNHWTIKGVMPGIAFGFALALFLEAVLLVGGRTIFTELLGWENAPKPISSALDASREKLVDVLGVTDAIPESNAKTKPTLDEVLKEYDKLNKSDKKDFESLVCPHQ